MQIISCFSVACLFFFPVGLPFFILTPKHDPFKRGFFCNDESIRYPLKEETIPYQLLGGVMIPFTLIVVRQILDSRFKSTYFSCFLFQYLLIFFHPSSSVVSLCPFTYLASRIAPWERSICCASTKRWGVACLELLPANL